MSLMGTTTHHNQHSWNTALLDTYTNHIQEQATKHTALVDPYPNQNHGRKLKESNMLHAHDTAPLADGAPPPPPPLTPEQPPDRARHYMHTITQPARQPSHQAKLYPPGASLICDDEYPLCQNQYVPQFLLEHAHVGGVIIATATCPCCCCRSIAGHCSGGNATFVLQTCKVPRNVLGPGYGCWRDCSE